MALLGGESFDPKLFFSEVPGFVGGASVDLTVGTIFDSDGKQSDAQTRLRPGQSVIVVSKEIFDLPNRVTAFVTCRSTLTRRGIWALTTGIVDPGWDGPVGTILINISRQDFLVAKGLPFLRASFHEHGPVSGKHLRRSPGLATYLDELRSAAATQLPTSFLDTDRIVERAKREALSEFAKFAGGTLTLGIAAAAVWFQIFDPFAGVKQSIELFGSRLHDLHDDVEKVDARLDSMEARELSQNSVRYDGLRGAFPFGSNVDGLVASGKEYDPKSIP